MEAAGADNYQAKAINQSGVRCSSSSASFSLIECALQMISRMCCCSCAKELVFVLCNILLAHDEADVVLCMFMLLLLAAAS